MSRKEKSRIDTGGGNDLGLNPFGGLSALGNLPQAPATSAATGQAGAASTQGAGAAAQVSSGGGTSAHIPSGGGTSAQAKSLGGSAASGSGAAKKFSGRIDIRREKSGRGGKVVTTLSGEGLAALPQAELEALLKQLKNRFGCGGSREGATLEVQGNLVDQLTPVLTQMGWRVVRTGG